MPISGLVVTLSSDRQQRGEAIDEISVHPRIEVGTIEFNRMAIVLDTPSVHEDKQVFCWLTSLPGVILVDVAMVGFDDDPTELATTPCNSPLPFKENPRDER